MNQSDRFGMPPASGFNLPFGTTLGDISGPDPCPTCEGEGEIENPRWESGVVDAPEMLTCPECRGTGLAEDTRRA